MRSLGDLTYDRRDGPRDRSLSRRSRWLLAGLPRGDFDIFDGREHHDFRLGAALSQLIE
jgi:hypothetical protein